MYRTLLLVTLLLLPSLSQAEEETNSGNFWQPKCKAVLADQRQNTLGGACIGIALVLKSMGRHFEQPNKVCIPEDAPVSQILQVITKGLDERPALLNEKFIS
jgi:hypothetical protein